MGFKPYRQLDPGESADSAGFPFFLTFENWEDFLDQRFFMSSSPVGKTQPWVRRVELTVKNHVIDWCDENHITIAAKPDFELGVFHFTSEKHAMMFKLRFG